MTRPFSFGVHEIPFDLSEKSGAIGVMQTLSRIAMMMLLDLLKG
ncbi:hypothetical protein CSC32_1176 [Pseudomonas aeruginosa]|nr:hypothetical protein CSC32_1176 [Pseudomonas aeruginosa]RCG90092.1 hypothetical protein CSB86_3492 [Pseudomonas aeruginosa]